MIFILLSLFVFTNAIELNSDDSEEELLEECENIKAEVTKYVPDNQCENQLICSIRIWDEILPNCTTVISYDVFDKWDIKVEKTLVWTPKANENRCSIEWLGSIIIDTKPSVCGEKEEIIEPPDVEPEKEIDKDEVKSSSESNYSNRLNILLGIIILILFLI